MRAISVKYHGVMFRFWYGRNSTMRDYHGKKYHQLLSLPVVAVSSGLNFRNYGQEVRRVIGCSMMIMSFTLFMLGVLAISV